VNVLLRRCEQTARAEGLATAATVALSEVDIAATAPGRWVAVPATRVPEDAVVRRHSLAGLEDIVFQECPGARPAGTGELVEIGRRLAAVRLGVLRRALDQAVEHLSGREGGGEPLVRKQLVVGALAGVMADIELLRQRASTETGPAALADLHDCLDELGWRVTQLFGAAGYIADHPARALYVSALLASTWVDRNPDRQGAAT
jgi:alkylation response protein AidB-like acyl-CoA dehydrogenase